MLFFIKLRKFPLVLTYWEIFINEWVLFFNCFFLLFIIWSFFFFTLLKGWITFIDFLTVEPVLHVWVNITWLWCIIILYIVKLNFLYFVEDFCISFHKIYWCVIFYSCLIFICFWYYGKPDLIEQNKKYSLCYCLLEDIRE